MPGPYLCERVGAMLNTCVWYYRLGQSGKAQRTFQKTIALIEAEGVHESGLEAVLADYAETFRSRGRVSEASTLAALAQRSRGSLPDTFRADGSRYEWWQQPSFTASLPALPVEYRASRVVESGGAPFLSGCLAVLIGGGLIIGLMAKLFGKPPDAIWTPYLVAMPLAGWMWSRRRKRRERLQMESLWVRLTPAGVDYRDAEGETSAQWEEIGLEKVYESRGGEDDPPFDVVVLITPRGKMRVSSQFFTDRETQVVEAYARLRTTSP